ncbi:MAG: cyoD [Candidatus Saccharibacteria bacterium]|nr:cyoD [Candidatus Saccharibacteria bacterium]
MSDHKQPLVSQFEPPHVSVRSYVIGFVSCLVLTIAAYVAAVSDSLSHDAAIAAIAALAVVQCVVQLRRFLHLGSEFKPRWKLAVFITMLTIVLIVVFGSLWIMNNLNYRMMQSPAEVNKYITEQDGL